MSDIDNNNTFDNDQDFMNMSDEDIMNMPAPEWSAYKEEESNDSDVEEHRNEEELADESLEEGDLEDQEDAYIDEEEDDEEDTSAIEDEDDESDDEEDEDSEDIHDEDEEEDDADEESEEEEDTSTDNDTDYKALYEDIMAPFKANKKEIKVDSPEELRRLAQMGVGYNAKMAEIKPLRKIGKMLENAGLLDESKINYLIDLSKNDIGAINKLIKDSGIDPLDLDTESTEYEPNTYTVNDNQLDLQDTLTTLGETESGVRVITEVDKKWDDSSKEVLLNNPNMFNTLASHVESGMYDKIMNIVEKERTLGNVPQGVTDLQAYTHIGEYLSKQEAETKVEEPKKKQPAKKPKVVKKNKADAKRNKLRQAAATSRSKSTKKTQNNLDILNMSDEEFEKKFS